MPPPTLSQAHELVYADERLLQLKLQAQDLITRNRGCCTVVTGGQRVADSGLVASLVRSAAYRTQQEQHPSGASSAATAQMQDGLTAADLQRQSVLAAVQRQWQKLIMERLHAAQMLLPDVPLAATARTKQELANLLSQAGDVSESWERIGSHNSPYTSNFQAPSVSKLLYDAEDLLQAITAAVLVDQPAAVSSKADDAAPLPGSTWSAADNGDAQEQQQQQQQPTRMSLLQVVRAPNRSWLQSFFSDLTPDRRQVGIDDVLHSWFKEQQVTQAYRSAASCSAAACRAAARTGLPPSERPWVWATALGIHAAPPHRNNTSRTAVPNSQSTPDQQAAVAAAGSTGGRSQEIQAPICALQAACEAASSSLSDWWSLPCQRDQQLLQLLCESVEEQVLLTDVLTCADVQRVADDEHYFVFEETIRAILLAFSRDPSVSTTAAVPAAPRLAAETKGGQQLRPYPASGVLPFQGLASFLAPLCYMYEHPAAVYRVFTAMYCRYWSCLHTLNVKPAPAAGLPALCRTFVELLQDVDLDVLQHLSRLTATPLDLAMPWIVSGFVGYLSPSETLLLWDRIIGFDSLLVLPVLAVAVMTFRRDLVLTAQSCDELLEMLEDLSQVRVVPLLQALLFDS